MKKLFISQSYALVPLGLTAWVAFSLSFVFANFSYVLVALSDPFGWGWDLIGTAGIGWTPWLTSLTPFLQVGVLVGGFLWAATHIAQDCQRKGQSDRGCETFRSGDRFLSGHYVSFDGITGRMKETLARVFAVILLLGGGLSIGLAWRLGQEDVITLHARMPEAGGWTPADLTVAAGQPLHLRLTSDDVMHGFAIGQSDQPAVDVKPGEMTDYTVTFDKAGTYTFYCTRWCGPNHWRMRGTITVTGETTEQPVTPPMYAQLGLDIDAAREAQVIPGATTIRPTGQRICALCSRSTKPKVTTALIAPSRPGRICAMTRIWHPTPTNSCGMRLLTSGRQTPRRKPWKKPGNCTPKIAPPVTEKQGMGMASFAASSSRSRARRAKCRQGTRP
jgi:heme/copper-type cytochrome/quinol oxidase subunit 2